MTTRSQISLALVSTLCAFTASATAEPYWITYEGNDLPENEGWERHWGNDDGSHEGDGAIRTVENGILTMDSMYDLRVYDYACHYLYGALDPDPGELFVAEWRVYIEDWVGDYGAPDSRVSVCSDDGWLLALGLFPDHVESQYEDGVNIPITPDVFHDYRLLSWDMHAYELYIDGELARVGSFWDDLLSSKFAWGDGVRGAASLAHWDYVYFGVVPEPSALWLFVAGLAACVLRTVRGSNRQVVFLPVLACVLAASATAEPYWIAYEGNDFPENEGWTRHINAAGGANRWIEDGALVIDSLHNAAIWDTYVIDGISDPGPGERFVAEWRVLSEEMLFWYDAGVTIARTAQPGNMKIRFGVEEIVVVREGEHIPIAPGEWHAYGVESDDMVEYTLSIDGDDVFTGIFEDQTFLQSFVAWGDQANGAASLTRWDYVRFGVVPEPQSLVYCILAALPLRLARFRQLKGH